MTTPALIFDCDGVLADTEQYGHLPAFNQTFADFGVPVRWSVAEYAEKVKIGGGKERMRSIVTPEVASRLGFADEAAIDEAILSWHKHKTAIYTDLVESGVMPARPGIARLVREAHEAGWALAVASTSAEAAVRAVLAHAVGDELAEQFAVFAGDIVPRKKPAPDIYLLAVSEMGLDPNETIVVEDSANGMQAALAAGLRTIVTVSGFTRDEDFTGASLVVTTLGDPSSGEPVEQLGNPKGVSIAGVVSLATLQEILLAPVSPAAPPTVTETP